MSPSTIFFTVTWTASFGTVFGRVVVAVVLFVVAGFAAPGVTVFVTVTTGCGTLELVAAGVCD
ncbi:hypothetical protein [Microbispora sp. H13382]|uniref:hypothetical protein n=1 Tax=Microbispora sp. H13382 TaxID=2729112 RepID=UPI00160402E6|nr:hypothetical protein [Microbispora sp. H13382]